MASIHFTVFIHMTCALLLPCFCEKLKLFQENLRMSSVSVATTAHSLAECSALFVDDKDSFSFNYNDVDQQCELSGDYPEQSSTVSEGWNVYAPIVNGEWNVWTNWDSCSATCGYGTQTRTRLCNNPPASNGGIQCPGDSYQTMSCYYQRCISANSYYISSYQTAWDSAKVACEGRNARLVIIDDQLEQEALERFTGGVLKHWIGLTCSSHDCTWIDGRPLAGFTAWAPAEPQGQKCVYIGYLGNKWDDAYCHHKGYFICEYL